MTAISEEEMNSSSRDHAHKTCSAPEGGLPEGVVGHKTFSNERGEHYHEPLRRDEAQALLKAADEDRDRRAAAMPTEKDAISALWNAQQRLRELGWREAIYCPKDGSSFDVIEPGSTGIFRAHYSGEWPKGGWWAEDAGDLWPSHPILYRPTEAERERWAAMAERFRGGALEASAQGASASEHRDEPNPPTPKTETSEKEG